jgi:hypothetical protein
MIARMILAALAGTLACRIATTPAVAADFGISFHYGTSGPHHYTACLPSYYTTASTRYYAAYAPRHYGLYGYADYYAPAVHAACSTPRVIVYDDRYPATYRTTYTRSRYYTRPVRHSRVTVHHRSGDRTYHHRKRAAYRRYYTAPRRSIRIHHGEGVSYRRPSISHYGYRDVHRRYPSPHNRVRVYRR